MTEALDPAYLEELFQEEIFILPRNTIVVVPGPWAKIPEEEKALLSKILSSVKLGLAGVCIISDPELSNARLLQLNPRYALVFGSHLEMEIKSYNVSTFEGIALISADKLQSLDESRKKLLWSALKEMYSI
jgi:hypothetical protein